MTQAADPRAKVWRPGDVWVSIGRPLTGIGGVRVRLNDEFLFFERGAIRSDAQQIPLFAVADVDASQSIAQRARHVGSIRVHVLRSDGVRETVVLEDLPDHRDGVEHINRMARAARELRMRQQNTHNYQQAPTQPVLQSNSDEVFAQLQRLAELRDQGVISANDFEVKKQEMLSRL